MLIDLSELLSTDNKKAEYTTKIEMDEFVINDSVYPIGDKGDVILCIQNVGKRKLTVKAEIHCSLDIPCDRCLENVNQRFDISIAKEIDMSRPSGDNEDGEEYPFIVENSFDVERFVYNEILVNMPMKILCSDDCKGICNRCGANLNTQPCDCDRTELDPRMSKILDVFNKFKEV